MTPWARAGWAYSNWLRLTSRERWLLMRAITLIPSMHVAVRVVGFHRLHGRVTAIRAAPPAPQHRETLIRECTTSINRVKRAPVFRGNCLSQSLALEWLLRRSGVAPTLRLGVRLGEPKFAAHAWIECDGRVLNDAPDVSTRFVPLATTPLGPGVDGH